jgi:hypothetical protein
MPRMMTRRMLSIGAAALALMMAVACIHVSRASAFQKATNPEQFERQMWDAVKAGKWLDVRAHMAESYRCAMPNGAHSRAEMMDFLKSMKLQGFKISNLQSSPNGADMVMTYDLELQGMASGQPIPPGRVHVLTVWQGVKRGWIEVAQSFTPEGQWPAGPAMMMRQ